MMNKKIKDDLREFYVSFLNKENCEIGPYSSTVFAKDLPHAMQKAAVITPTDAVEVVILLKRVKR